MSWFFLKLRVKQFHIILKIIIGGLTYFLIEVLCVCERYQIQERL